MKAANTRPADHRSLATPRSRAIGSLLLALALLCVFAPGCGTRRVSPAPPAPEPMGRETYTIGVTDVLRITVWRNDELNLLVPVRPDGKISVRLLDDIQAEGLTPTDLKEILTREYSEFITAPNVTVVVVELNSRFVSVIGGVMLLTILIAVSISLSVCSCCAAANKEPESLVAVPPSPQLQ